MTTKGKIDRNDAPEGTKAVRMLGKKNYNCSSCAFSSEDNCPYNDIGTRCCSGSRKDGQSVVFIRKEPKC